MAKKKTAQRIMDAAYLLACQKGISNISMRDIASAAGVAPSQLTYHYKTKENLICALIDYILEHNEPKMREAVKEGNCADEKINLLSRFVREALSKNRELMNLVLDVTLRANWAPAFKSKISDVYSAAARTVCRIVGLENEAAGEKRQNAVNRFFRALYEAAVSSTMELVTPVAYSAD